MKLIYDHVEVLIILLALIFVQDAKCFADSDSGNELHKVVEKEAQLIRESIRKNINAGSILKRLSVNVSKAKVIIPRQYNDEIPYVIIDGLVQGADGKEKPFCANKFHLRMVNGKTLIDVGAINLKGMQAVGLPVYSEASTPKFSHALTLGKEYVISLEQNSIVSGRFRVPTSMNKGEVFRIGLVLKNDEYEKKYREQQAAEQAKASREIARQEELRKIKIRITSLPKVVNQRISIATCRAFYGGVRVFRASNHRSLNTFKFLEIKNVEDEDLGGSLNLYYSPYAVTGTCLCGVNQVTSRDVVLPRDIFYTHDPNHWVNIEFAFVHKNVNNSAIMTEAVGLFVHEKDVLPVAYIVTEPIRKEHYLSQKYATSHAGAIRKERGPGFLEQVPDWCFSAGEKIVRHIQVEPGKYHVCSIEEKIEKRKTFGVIEVKDRENQVYTIEMP